jgi:serine/threonine protein kinase
MFYEMLGGRPPFDFPTLTRICAELASDKQPPSLRTANPDISEHLETVIMQCFARDRDHRIPNVAELAGQILDAVEAPFAGQVKTKIAMVLDPRSQILSTTTSSGGLPLSTGNYRSLSISGGSMTGTGPQRLSSSGAIRLALDASQGPSSGTTANGVESAITPAEAGKKRVLAIGIGVAALLALGGIFFVVSSSHGTPEASPGKGVQATAPTTTTNPVVATPPSTAASPTPSGSAPSATAADSAAAAAAASAASNPPANHGGGGGGVFHPRHGGGGGGRTAPPPPPVVTAAPAPAPAPTPTPAPKPSSNPLEDRQ